MIVRRISYFLNKQPDIEAFCWAHPYPLPTDWITIVGDVLGTCDAFVFFIANDIGKTQKDELEVFRGLMKKRYPSPEEAETEIQKASVIIRQSNAPEKLMDQSIQSCLKDLCCPLKWPEIHRLPSFPSKNGNIDAFKELVDRWENAAQECAKHILKILLEPSTLLFQ